MGFRSPRARVSHLGSARMPLDCSTVRGKTSRLVGSVGHEGYGWRRECGGAKCRLIPCTLQPIFNTLFWRLSPGGLASLIDVSAARR
jgi:hypothetical protein